MTDKTDSVLAFRVADSRFGVRLDDIKEIVSVPFGDILCAPSFPECVMGIVNIRGKIVPVLDTWLLTGEERKGGTDLAVVCLFERDGDTAGFAVDELLDTVYNFDLCDEAADDCDKPRLCPVHVRTVNGVSTGLINTGELYLAARVKVQEGSGA